MIYMKITAITNAPDLCIDGIEVRPKTNKLITLDWDESDYKCTNAFYNGFVFSGEYKNIHRYDDKDIDIKEIIGSKICNVLLYSESHPDDAFIKILYIKIYDDNNEYILKGTEDCVFVYEGNIG